MVGVPTRNPKTFKDTKGKGRENFSIGGFVKEHNKNGSKWYKNKQEGRGNMAANACSQGEGSSGSGITAHQLEQLLKLLPLPSKHEESDEDMEVNFVEMVECNLAQSVKEEWIIDSGATHHMTVCKHFLMNQKKMSHQARINLSTGHTSDVTFSGEVTLANDLVLQDVMFVPAFKHNLISVQKLTQHQGCKVSFLPEYYTIQDNVSEQVRGVGRAVKGVYYLINESVEQILKNLSRYVKQWRKESKATGLATAASSELLVTPSVEKQHKVNHTTLWHHRLGHAPLARIKQISGRKGVNEGREEECLTCPVAKFTRPSFKKSLSRAPSAFDLIHLDTWGPYRVATRSTRA